MASYEILWKRSVEKDLRKVDKKYLPKIFQAIRELKRNPFPSKVKRISGTVSFFRIRVGDYRVIYQVNKDTGEIIIYYIRHRREAYRFKGKELGKN